MHDWKPHETLWLVLKPAEEVLSFDGRLEKFSVLVDAGTFEARSD